MNSALLQRSDQRRYYTLDGLRGLAALAVAAFHLGTFPALKHAWVAVDLFFLMSGFVLASAYEARIKESGVWSFLRSRLIRLYPMLLLGTATPVAVFILVYARGHANEAPGPVLTSAALSLLYLPSRMPHSNALFPLNGPFWSLSCEMAVNVVYALLLPLLSVRVLAVIVGLSGAVFGYALLSTGIDFTPDWANWGWCVPRTAYSFFLGVLIFRSPRPRTGLPVILCLLVGALLLTVVPPSLAILAGFPLLLVFSVGNERASATLGLAGALSYPLYALHSPLIVPLEHSFERLGATETQAAIGALAAILIVSAVALKLWDQPLRRVLGRLASRAMSPASAQA